MEEWYAPLLLGFSAWVLARATNKHVWVDIGLCLAKVGLLCGQDGVWRFLHRVVYYAFETGMLGRDSLWASPLLGKLFVVSATYHLLQYGLSTTVVHYAHVAVIGLYAAYFSPTRVPAALLHSVGAFEFCTAVLLLLPAGDSVLKLSVFGSVRVLLFAYLIHAQRDAGMYVLSGVLVCQLLMAYEVAQVARHMYMRSSSSSRAGSLR